jgi:E3 ubiquitin-protein ligase UBR7
MHKEFLSLIYDLCRDDLIKYLRPFAQEGKVVNEGDVREFFASLAAAKKK